ncbi:MAG: DUF222 domain-containing protein [Microbacterium sp.]
MKPASTDLLEAVDRLEEALRGATRSAMGGEVAGMTDAGLRELTQRVEALGRHVDALRIGCAAEIDERSRVERGNGRMSAQHGCASATELLTRLTRVSARNAAERIRIGRATTRPRALSGEPLPPRFAHVSDALARGAIGIDAAVEIVRGLSLVSDRCDTALLDAAESELVAAATGTASDGSPAFSADDLRVQVKVWSLVLDPDGVLPDYERALRGRTLTLGRERDGLVPVNGRLLPDVAAQLRRLIDAHLSPRVADRAAAGPAVPADGTPGGPVFHEDPVDGSDGVVPHDERTRAQKQHDVLAAVLGAAARAPETPSIGGAPPTLLVTVAESDLHEPAGIAFVDGTDTAVPARLARQIACTGGIQRLVLGDDGKIIELGSPQRTFTPHQRRAIVARDGECVIPGCHVPAEWCELHHVVDHAKGGPTHTGNGVVLCWWHHRSLETSGWAIRMIDGVPEVRAPYYIDPYMTWRPVPGSAHRRRERRRRETG